MTAFVLLAMPPASAIDAIVGPPAVMGVGDDIPVNFKLPITCSGRFWDGNDASRWSDTDPTITVRMTQRSYCETTVGGAFPPTPPAVGLEFKGDAYYCAHGECNVVPDSTTGTAKCIGSCVELPISSVPNYWDAPHYRPNPLTCAPIKWCPTFLLPKDYDYTRYADRYGVTCYSDCLEEGYVWVVGFEIFHLQAQDKDWQLQAGCSTGLLETASCGSGICVPASTDIHNCEADPCTLTEVPTGEQTLTCVSQTAFYVEGATFDPTEPANVVEHEAEYEKEKACDDAMHKPKCGPDDIVAVLRDAYVRTG